MALLASYRRPWALMVFSVLLIPVVGSFAAGRVGPGVLPAQWWKDPARKLAPTLDSKYGLREQVVRWHGRYRDALRSPSTPKAFHGKGGQLFYGLEGTLQQSTGMIFRETRLDRFVGMAAQLDKAVRGYGGKLIVGSAPNAQTMLAEALPAWARREQGARLEYDYVFQRLAAAGLTTFDLRAALKAAQEESPTYLKTDTHWNNRGALIAFNTAMTAAGLPDLQIPASIALQPMEEGPGGDLTVLLGLSSVLKEPFQFPWKESFVSQGRPKDLPPLPGHDSHYAFETDQPGPSILVIGDSFTTAPWRPLLAKTFRRVHWIHMHHCWFDWEEASGVRAEVVVLVPTERYLGCPGSAWPKGLPRSPEVLQE